MNTLKQLGDTSLPFYAPCDLEGIYGRNNYRVHIIAMGDVGGTLAMGLHLLGGDIIDYIGVFDFDENKCRRFEMEINQIMEPDERTRMPEVRIIAKDDIYDCDLLLFCATKAVPPVEPGVKADMRMLQYEANKPIVESYAKEAASCGFKGILGIVSDPVDPLCKAAYQAALAVRAGAINPYQIKGFGLGVMNARGRYYAKRDSRFSSFLSEGRSFGPHGASLVLANSITNYDDSLSKELTDLAVKSNLVTRDLGFKPYLAPAMSSAALSILRLLRGEWHYSSTYIRGVYFGSYNMCDANGPAIELLELPDALWARIESAYNELAELN